MKFKRINIDSNITLHISSLSNPQLLILRIKLSFSCLVIHVFNHITYLLYINDKMADYILHYNLKKIIKFFLNSAHK